MSEPGRSFLSPRLERTPGRVACVVGVLVLVGVGLMAPMALVVAVLDGVPAALVLAAATLGGLWPVRWLAPAALPLRWHLLLGAGLGTGVLCLAVLVLGLLGWLSFGVAVTGLAASTVAGVVRLYALLGSDRVHLDRDERDGAGGWRWLWLAVVPFAVLGVLVAAVPPGLLWAEEGNGYDVLEYHLQMPREYFEAGRIAYAPHNVYANFPANAEMLYLLCMVLKSDAVQAAGMAKMLNLGLAVLVVAVGWLIGRERSPVTGVVTGVVTAATGWLVYLSGVAYVENAMLFFGLLSLAALLRATKDDEAERATWRGRFAWLVAAGLLAGLACGCKYTAIVLIAIPLAVVAAGGRGRPAPRRVIAVAVFGGAALLAFAPWLVKNAAMTGDPVFPLGGGWVREYPAGWGADEARHFLECHRPALSERTLSARLAMLWTHVPADPAQRFGPLVLVAAVAGVMAGRRRRSTWLCALVLAVQIGMWLFGTHLYARFAVVLLIPLVALVAAAGDAMAVPPWRWIAGGLLVPGVLFNAWVAGRLYHAHLFIDGAKLAIEGVPEAFAQGKVSGYEFYGAVNNDLPPDAKVLAIGEARAFYFDRHVDYCVVFNRNPFAEAAGGAGSPSDAIAWLTRHGYSHVLLNWQEIARLRGSRYGFPPQITRALFDALVREGLDPIASIRDTATGRPYGEVYALRQ